jgi:uncharacterized protein (TIGR02246 family)
MIDADIAAAVQATIAAYAQALDAGRTSEIADLFTPDGVAEIVGMAKFEGREAIRAGYGGFAPDQPQLHLVANTVLTSATADEATAVSNFAFFHRGEAGWSVQMAGRYDDTLRLHEGSWLFQSRVTSFG